MAMEREREKLLLRQLIGGSILICVKSWTWDPYKWVSESLCLKCSLWHCQPLPARHSPACPQSRSGGRSTWLGSISSLNLNQVTSQRRWFGKAMCAIGKTDKGHWCLSPLFTTTATRYIYIYTVLNLIEFVRLTLHTDQAEEETTWYCSFYCLNGNCLGILRYFERFI